MKYLLSYNSDRYRQLVNQTAITHTILPSPSTHNASWDAFMTSNKRIFFSLCSELTTSEYAKLMEYDVSTNEVKELFYTKNKYFHNSRQIRDSKIHTAISEREDNTLIMVTHTTDKSPEHPAWLPQSYYNNLWTGYSGSALLIYNPLTAETVYFGIPVQRESLYGGVYHPKTKCYYALGYLKGHLYKINLDTKEVKDYGQVVEKACYRMIIGSDNNIYFSTRNGVLMRLNINTDTVENTKHQLPRGQGWMSDRQGYACYMINGPDQRLYIATMYTDIIVAYDPKKDELVEIGSYKTTEYYTDVTKSYDYLGAMGFDSAGVLYGVICANRLDQEENYKIPASLVRWDYKNKLKPEHLGILGSEERAIVTCCSLLIDKEKNETVVISTNHGNDAPDILKLDLSKLHHKSKYLCKDNYLNQDNESYIQHNKDIKRTVQYWDSNSCYWNKRVIPINLWKNITQLGSTVCNSLSFEGEQIVVGFSDNTRTYYDRYGEYIKTIECNMMKYEESVTNIETDSFYPGRQFLSVVKKTITLSDGKKVGITEDGILLYFNDESTMSFGPISIQGSLIDWTKLHHLDVIYGVAGDKDDFSTVFKFDLKTGLKWLGHLGYTDNEYATFNSPQAARIAVSDDDQTLVIVSAGNLPVLYIYDIKGE